MRMRMVEYDDEEEEVDCIDIWNKETFTWTCVCIIIV